MKYFGTDGIRGKVNDTLTPDIAYRLGRSLVALGGSQIVIATDTRASKDELFSLIAGGAMAMGLDVIDAGIMPTPALIYYSGLKKITGVMVTASHNPYYDNGIKVLDKGEKLSEAKELEIEALMDCSDVAYSFKVGRLIRDIDCKSAYISMLMKYTSKTKKKIALDCANGATFETAPYVFKQMGEVVVCANNPDGYNINKGVGSTNLDNLSKFVVANKCDYGFAFDGDGDRVLACDCKGNHIDGDMLIYILGTKLYQEGRLNHNQIVFTCMSNLGMINRLHKMGIKTSITPVGDKYVVRELLDNGYSVGGEASGHIIMPDLLKTGDGTLIALNLVKILEDTSFSELIGDIMLYPETLTNLKVKNKQVCELKEVKERVKEIKELLGQDSKVFIRPSGTEDLLRITVSAPNLDDVNKYTEELKALVLSYTEVKE